MHARIDMADHLLAAADKIDLTDEQKTKLKEIRRKAPSMLMPKRQAVMEARMDLNDLMDQDDAKSADLRAAHDKLQKAQDELRDAQFELRLQSREVLTPEQRDKLHKAMREGRGERGRGYGRMGMAPFAPDAPFALLEPDDDFGPLGPEDALLPPEAPEDGND
jgi:Spy/CpxP family protein refolding chaperone